MSPPQQIHSPKQPLVAAADFHEAPARSGDLNRGGEDLDAGLSWDRWKIREGEEDGG